MGGLCGDQIRLTISWITSHRWAANVALLLQSNGETKTEGETRTGMVLSHTEDWKTQKVQNPVQKLISTAL